MSYEISDVIRHFAAAVDIASHGNGHINDTYLADCSPKCILQKINTSVFKNPTTVMENIVNVTEHLKKKIRASGGDENREILRVIKTIDGADFYTTPDGDCFRMFNFIENSVCHDIVENPNQLFEAAKAFGKFQNMLADFPAEKLYETIPDFHDTKKRFEKLKSAIAEDRLSRLGLVRAEVDFALAREADTSVIVDAIADGSVPVRVTHNDTKLNNVMFDATTDKAVCVIDLDTVMPGSLLYDYGDALRFGASTGAEDEVDLDKIEFDLELFEAFTKGFLGEVGDKLTERERELLPLSAKLMTYECGIRFLTDYLEGDTYFKIHRENHNLDRARTQFKLVADIEKKMEQMTAIVAKY